jgi:hypothetical protein
MTLEQLKALRASGKFHHATYREIGKVWEGLYIYEKDATGFRGFLLAGAFNKSMDPEGLRAAEAEVAGTGVSVGAYGNG